MVSTDFIKSSRRCYEFLRTCPDLVMLGLLSPHLAALDLDRTRDREELARYLVQRRRRDIRRYLDEDRPSRRTAAQRRSPTR